MSSDCRRFNPIRAEKRDFQRSREFGRPQLHRAIVRTREQSPAWPPAVVVRPVEAPVAKEAERV
jgi:hypothetical protein